MTDFVANCVTDFCIFLSFKSVGKSFGGTYALIIHFSPTSRKSVADVVADFVTDCVTDFCKY